MATADNLPVTPTATIIVFPAILAEDQFATQHVALGAPFTSISIKLVDSASGVHEFMIAKNLPHQHPSVLQSAVVEAKLQIDHFWTVLAFVRDTVIRPTGEVFYEFNGQRHQVNRPSRGSGAKGVGVASAGWFDVNRTQMMESYDLDRLKRLNYARAVPEPIGRFMALYSLLDSAGKGMQGQVDRLILSVEPTTHQTTSPHNGQLETLYTRLRNELAHVRPTATVFSTHEEIIVHLPRFEWIVKAIVRRDVLAGRSP